MPVPIPGDLLVIGAGVAASGEPTSALAILAAILLAGYVGGSLQFLMARGALRPLLVRILVRVGVSQERLDALGSWLARRGRRGVAAARVTPGVRVGAIAASGLAALPFSVFLPGLVAGNALFVGGHFALGYAVGPTAVDLVAGGGVVAAGVVAFVALAAVGAIGWSVLRRRRIGVADAMTGPGTEGGGFGAWADAACPACLGLAVIDLVDPEAARRRP